MSEQMAVISQKTLVSLSTVLIVVGLIVGYVIKNEHRLTAMETTIENQKALIEIIEEKCK